MVILCRRIYHITRLIVQVLLARMAGLQSGIVARISSPLYSRRHQDSPLRIQGTETPRIKRHSISYTPLAGYGASLQHLQRRGSRGGPLQRLGPTATFAPSAALHLDLPTSSGSSSPQSDDASGPAYTPPAALPPTPSGATLGAVLPYLARLAFSDPGLYWRVAVAFLLLFISKASGLLAPLYFKHAVDALAAGAGAVPGTAAAAATTALLLSGACRMIGAVAKEVQHPIFTPISQVGCCSCVGSCPGMHGHL